MEDKIRKELLDNFNEFVSSAEDDMRRERFNPAAASYFKSIAILCDFGIYQKVRLLPKNHAERFLYLRMHFKEAYDIIAPLFKDYTDSYNKRISKENALRLKENVEKIKRVFEIK